MERFQASMLWRHADDMTVLYYKLSNNTPISIADLTNLANCAGNLNYWRHQAEGGNPPPPSGDPLADLKFRRTVSKWAAYGNDFFTRDESNKLKTYPDLANTVSQINNFYKTYANFPGKREGNLFFYSDGFTWLPDVDGAADAQVLKYSGGVQPPDLNYIP